MACRTSPGIITARTIDKFDNYPYDGVLYMPNRICPTVNIRKLARSKYDRMTKRHIARFDHYCAWINQAVGEENYRYFLLFLAIHVFLCWYGTIVTFYIFKNETDEMQLFQAKFISVATGTKMDANKWIVFQFLFAQYMPLAGVFLLLSVMSILLSAFLIFHLHLIVRGMTTNEFYKWRSLRKYYRQNRPGNSSNASNATATNTPGNEGDLSSTSNQVVNGHVDTSSMKNTESSQPLNHVANKQLASSALCPETEKDSRLSRHWKGPPRNIYNVGIIQNFKEVLNPLSLRPPEQRVWPGVWTKTPVSNNGEKLKAKTS